MDIFTIGRITSTTQSTIDYLKQEKLLHNTYKCCGQDCYLIKYNGSKDGLIWRCSSCRKTYSIRRDSFFSKSHLSLCIILLIIYLFSVGSSISQTLSHLKSQVSKKVIIDWYSFIRDTCKSANDKLHKFCGVVEIDETYFHGLKKNDRGSHGLEPGEKRPIVFGIFERITKHIKLFYVTSTKARTLIPLIENNVEKGSTINSDGAAVYKQLSSRGYSHNVVYHNLEFVNENGEHTNNIENTWGHLKNDNRSRRGAPKSMKEQHLQEFVFKWNARQDGKEMFTAILDSIREQYPLT